MNRSVSDIPTASNSAAVIRPQTSFLFRVRAYGREILLSCDTWHRVIVYFTMHYIRDSLK